MATPRSRQAVRASLRSAGWTMDPLAVPGLAFVLLLILLGATGTRSFLSPFNISNVLLQVTPLILIALGQALVIGSGGFDLGYDHAEPDEEKEMFALQRRLLLTFLAGR